MPNEQQPTVIQGEDVVVTVDEKEMLHAAEHNLKLSPTFKEFRTKHTNGKKKSPGDIDWTIDASGFVVIDPEITNAHTPDEIIGIILSKKEVTVTLKSKGLAESAAISTYEGKAFFTDFSLGSKAGEDATYNATISSSGNLEKKQIV